MENLKEQKNCCKKDVPVKEKKGFWSGIIYGLVPHTLCILFIVFTVLGVTTATAFLKPLLLNHYFFYILIAISFVFVTIAAIIYLKKNAILSFEGVKKKRKYLLILYGTAIGINLLLFMVVFPITANLNPGTTFSVASTAANADNGKLPLTRSGALITLKVEIPCSGHASLITGELKKISGVENVKFRLPNLFDIGYDSQKTTQEEILSLEVFDTYKATLVGG